MVPAGAAVVGAASVMATGPARQARRWAQCPIGCGHDVPLQLTQMRFASSRASARVRNAVVRQQLMSVEGVDLKPAVRVAVPGLALVPDVDGHHHFSHAESSVW